MSEIDKGHGNTVEALENLRRHLEDEKHDVRDKKGS